jgi:hypothetical protein
MDQVQQDQGQQDGKMDAEETLVCDNMEISSNGQDCMPQNSRTAVACV